MHNTSVLIYLLLIGASVQVLAQQCSSSQFSVQNNGVEYLTINSPTEVKTCGGINICSEIQNGKQSLSLSASGEVSLSNGNSIQLPDNSASNELQTLTLNNGELAILNGNAVQLPDASATNELQNLSLSPDSKTLSIANGNSITLPDASSTNELQTLSLTDNTLSISDTNQVTLPIPRMVSVVGSDVSVSAGFGPPATWQVIVSQSIAVPANGTIVLHFSARITIQSPANTAYWVEVRTGTTPTTPDNAGMCDLGSPNFTSPAGTWTLNCAFVAVYKVPAASTYQYYVLAHTYNTPPNSQTAVQHPVLVATYYP